MLEYVPFGSKRSVLLSDKTLCTADGRSCAYTLSPTYWSKISRTMSMVKECWGGQMEGRVVCATRRGLERLDGRRKAGQVATH
jgi:hypothetical protein